MPVRRLAVLISVVAAIVGAAVAAAVVPAVSTPTYHAERFHARIVVEPGGSIVVTETVRFVFGPKAFTFVFRELPAAKTDGLTILEASMDGVPMARGKGPGQFEVKSDDGRRRIVWHFPPTSDAGRTFVLTYRAAGVVWQDAGSDVLAWTLLPTRHEYPISCASGEVEYPAASPLVADVVFDPPASDTRHEGQAVQFERCPVERNGTWVVTMRFAPRSVAAVAPEWQQRSIRTRANMPLFFGLAGLVLLAGGGGFTLFGLNHRQARLDRTGPLASPPDTLAPALAGTLIRTGASAGWGAVLGGIMDLARRGAITMQNEERAGVFTSHQVRISAGPAPRDAALHERVLLELLFTDKSGPRTSVTFSELARTFASSRRWKRLRTAIATDLRGAGLIDPERERTRGRVTGVGLALMVASVAGLVASVTLISRVGEAVLALPLALLVVGIAGAITGSAFSPLSEEGHRRAERWRAFKRALGAKPGEFTGSAPAADQVERWLPYAAAFGTALPWMKRLQKQGVALGPSWLAAVSLDGARGPASMGATVAILSAGSSAGAHAGGGAGGGSAAAGGGASGAG